MSGLILWIIVIFLIFKFVNKKNRNQKAQEMNNTDSFDEKNNFQDQEKKTWVEAFLGNMNQIQQKVNDSINTDNQPKRQKIEQDDLSYRQQTPQTVRSQMPYKKEKSVQKAIEPEKEYKKIDIKNDEFEVWKKSFYDDVDRYLDVSEYLGKEKLEK